MSTRAKKLLQHEVVWVLPLIKQHRRCEANRADEESQPVKAQDHLCDNYLLLSYIIRATWSYLKRGVGV